MPSSALFFPCSVWLQPVWLKLTKEVQAPNHQDFIFFRLLECKTFSLYLSKIWRKSLLNKGTMCITTCGIFLKISAVPCLSFYYHENTHLGQKRTVSSSNINHLIPYSDSLSSPSAHAIQSSDIIYITGTQSLRSCLKVDPEQVSNLFIPLPNHSWAFIQK